MHNTCKDNCTERVRQLLINLLTLSLKFKQKSDFPEGNLFFHALIQSV